MTHCMIDACCTKCRHHIGWCGTMRDMPACPRCGYRLPQDALDRDQAVLNDFRALLREHPLSRDRDVRTKQRHYAGLSLRQAAKLLDVHPEVLDAIENLRGDPLPWLQAKMIDVYGLHPQPVGGKPDAQA